MNEKGFIQFRDKTSETDRILSIFSKHKPPKVPAKQNQF